MKTVPHLALPAISLRVIALLLLALLLGGCERGERARLLAFGDLGELRVATRQDALSYFIGPDGTAQGFEHDLLVKLGQRLGVPVRFIVFPTSAAALRAVQRGNVHLAAAGLVRNDALQAEWSSAVRPVDYVLVCRADCGSLADETALRGKLIGVRPGSVPALRVQQLQRNVAGIRLAHARIGGEAELLEMLAEGRLDLAATDRLSFQVAAKYHPELRVAMSLGLQADVSWAIARDAAHELHRKVEAFLAEARKDGILARVSERYLGHVDRLDEQHAAAFLERMQSRLPDYREIFRAAAERFGLDWRLIAAVAYQESQWEPSAVSPTGVRGMMMLTEETARRLGVRDRLDAQQSIFGGARYLAMLRDELPAEIMEPDRTWMAVAAYNLGMGHLRGAGAIARSLRKDHTSWSDMKRVLPLISRPDYAARLRAGAGRGGEAVIMTESVRNYYDILAKYEAAPQLAPRASLPAPPVQGASTSRPPM